MLVALAPLCLAKPFDGQKVMDMLETLQVNVKQFPFRKLL